SFSFADSNTVNFGLGGAGAGKATFAPLTLTFSQSGLNPALFHALASGTPFQEVDVLGYANPGASPLLLEDFSFGGVGATHLGLDQSGLTQLSLQFSSEEIQQYIKQPDGTLASTPIVDSWNRVLNDPSFSTDGTDPGDPAAPPASSDVTAAAS